MTVAYYDQLALEWNPESNTDSQFKLITAIVITTMLLLGLVLSAIDVPEKERVARTAVPERIANFILEKEKPKPKVVKPKPKPKPKPQPKPKVKKLQKNKLERKPLTKQQVKAREKAANSGLLALGNELSDLMDTSDVSSMVGGSVKGSSASATTAAGHDRALLTSNTSQGSGGVDAGQYSTRVAQTSLSQREITQVRQSLLSPEAKARAESRSSSTSQSGKDGVRAEEDITIVFDQNKSRLYSIYNRARRTNPGLKGKIVLAITIAPSGKVISVKIVSSELNDSKLESRLVSRIKQFNFGARPVEKVTVTYPIEFLPS